MGVFAVDSGVGGVDAGGHGGVEGWDFGGDVGDVVEEGAFGVWLGKLIRV